MSLLFHRLFVVVLLVSVLAACATSPTGRRQLMLVSEDSAIASSAQAYVQEVGKLKKEGKLSSDQALIPFVRYEEVDTQDEVPAGFGADPANDLEVLTAGLHWRPRPGIAVKLDAMDFEDGAGQSWQQYDVSLGYSF